MPDEAKKVHFFFIGSIGVGKSAIIQQILEGTFVPEHKPTQYTSLVSETSISGHRVTFQDTRGSDTVYCLRLSVPSKRCALVCVYDVTDRDSLRNVENTISEFRAWRFTNPVILLGNKTDKEGECIVRRESVEERHPEAFVEEVSATTRTEATSPFVSLLNNNDFMRRLDAYSSELDGAQILQTDATLKRRARAGCMNIPFLWLQQLFYKLERPEPYFVAQASDFSTVTLERETKDSPSSRASSVLLPTTPAENPASVKDDQISSPISKNITKIHVDEELTSNLPGWSGTATSGRRRQKLEPSFPEQAAELPTCTAWRPPSALLPPPPSRTAEEQVREAIGPASGVETVLFVKGKRLLKLLKPISTPAGVDISYFFHKNTVYWWVRAPTDLKELIERVRCNLPRHQTSTPGICTIGEFWYAITGDGRHCYASALWDAAALGFELSLRRYEDMDCATTAQQSLLQGYPSKRVRRDIWSIFVYNRGQLITHIVSSTAAKRKLLDVSLYRGGVNLLFFDGSIQVAWSDCTDLNSVGIHLNPTIQRISRNLMGSINDIRPHTSA